MGDIETLADALTYLKPDLANNGTISLRAPKARQAVEMIEASIAALRAQDREDGAREMRERAAACCREEADKYDSRHEYDDGFLQGCKESASLIEALPLSPARKEDGDA